MNKVFFAKIDGVLTPDQRRMVADSMRNAVGSDAASVIVSDREFEVSVSSPYQLSERLGEYEKAYGFPSAAELRRFEQQRKVGLWYDFESGESNDSRWAQNGNMKFFDAATGDEIREVVFYHSGTYHLERLALDDSGQVIGCRGPSTGNISVIVETRQLRVEFPGDSKCGTTDG